MAKILLLSTSLRSAPVVFSVVAHAVVAVAAGLGGHAAATGSPGVTEVEIDLAPPPVAPEEIPAPAAEGPMAAFPTHTHDYPVPPDHDAHPHDPSIVHDRTPLKAPPSSHEIASAAVSPEPPQARDAVVQAPAAAPPVFTITLGRDPVSPSHTGSRAGPTGAGASDIVGDGLLGADGLAVPESLVTSRARLVSEVRPTYPIEARNLQVEAEVGLEIVVDTSGAVVDARVVRRAGYGMDEAALVAVRRDRFTSARRAGKPVNVRMPWVVTFHLE